MEIPIEAKKLLTFKQNFLNLKSQYTTNPTEHGRTCSASKSCRALAEHPPSDVCRALAEHLPSNFFQAYPIITQEGVKHTKYSTCPKSARQMLAERSVDIARYTLVGRR